MGLQKPKGALVVVFGQGVYHVIFGIALLVVHSQYSWQALQCPWDIGEMLMIGGIIAMVSFALCVFMLLVACCCKGVLVMANLLLIMLNVAQLAVLIVLTVRVFGSNSWVCEASDLYAAGAMFVPAMWVAGGAVVVTTMIIGACCCD